MRTIFVPLSKAYGLYVVYTGITFALSMMPVLFTLRSPAEDEFMTESIASIYGTNITVTGISFTTVILITIIAAWLLIVKAEWLADKLDLPQSGAESPGAAKAILYAGIKLIGLYVIIQGVIAFVPGLFYLRHSPPFVIFVLSTIVPPLLRIGIGLLLVLKTSFIYKTLEDNFQSAEQAVGGDSVKAADGLH
jgi:hypothetical protein